MGITEDTEALTAPAFAGAVDVSNNSFSGGDNGEDDEVEITFLSMEEVIEMHNGLMLLHTPHEPRGIRDVGLLESALFSPQNVYCYSDLPMEYIAAAYVFSLAQNHAFEQGNKRVAFSACSAFLRRNGYKLTLTQEGAIDLTLRVVNGQIERDEAAEIIANASESID